MDHLGEGYKRDVRGVRHGGDSTLPTCRVSSHQKAISSNALNAWRLALFHNGVGIKGDRRFGTTCRLYQQGEPHLSKPNAERE